VRVNDTGIGPGGGTLIAMCHDGVLVFAAAHGDGHYWAQFLTGGMAKRRVVALSTKDGSRLWTKAVGCRIRPLIVGDTLYAEPWAFDLHTGEQKTRTHPLTGRTTTWELERPGHHCGCIAGSPNVLLFRSGCMGYYDLKADQGTQHWGGQRPGCWINMIPANGLVVAPEASSGCVCNYSIHCTVVFKPRKLDKAWAVYASRGDMTPVKTININLGAPGDRRDGHGNLWLSYPRPWGRMRMDFKLDTAILPQCGYFEEAAEHCRIAGTDTPWTYSSGCSGLTKCTVPLVGETDGDALYTVRLGFADTTNQRPGQRVFDIKLQDKMVEPAFDIVRAAGGPNRAVVRQYQDIQVSDALRIELVPKVAQPAADQAPLLNNIEIARERVLRLGLTAPSFLLNDRDREQAGEVKIANRTDRPFTGTLMVAAPPGFSVTPSESKVSLAPDAGVAVRLLASVVQKGQAGLRPLELKLLRPDGTVECTRQARLEYLGSRGRLVIQADQDTYVSAGSPTANNGAAANLLVDGGTARMGDESHNIGYLRFPLNIPGKPVSVIFRIHTAPSEAAESNDSGRIFLLDAPWDQAKIGYADRPKPGQEIGVLGKVDRNVWVERPLKVDLTGRKELSLILEPTSLDGASYLSREGGQAPELVIEYEGAP